MTTPVYRLHLTAAHRHTLARAINLALDLGNGNFESLVALPHLPRDEFFQSPADARAALAGAKAMLDTQKVPFPLVAVAEYTDASVPDMAAAEGPAEILLSKEQANACSNVLDMYSRLLMAQFWALEGFFTWRLHAVKASFSPEDSDDFESLLQKAGYHMTGHTSNSSWGVHWPALHPDCRTAWDLYQVLRHRLAWDNNPRGSFQTHYDTPRKSSSVPLATVTRVDGAAPPENAEGAQKARWSDSSF